MIKRLLADRRIRFWLGLSLVVLLAASLAAAYFLLPGFGRRGSDIRIGVPLPGLASDGRFDKSLRAPGIRQRIADRLTGAVETPGGDTVYLPFDNFRVTAERTFDTAERSEVLVAGELLLYAQALAEQGRRADFLTFMSAFESVFLQGASPVERVAIASGERKTGPEDDALWFAYEKALLLAWQRWPEARIEQSLRRGIAVLKPRLDDGTFGRPADLPQDVLYPWVSTDVTPTPLPPKAARIVVLSDIDLYVLQALQAFDPDFDTHYVHWRDTLAQSVAPVGAPFPAYAAWADGSGYIHVQGDQFSVDTVHVLKTLLTLAETGGVPEASIDFFRQLMLDGRGIHTQYRVSDGAPLGEPASADLYACLARLGRASGDATLTEQALEALNGFYASSQTSLIFGGMFRHAPRDAFDLRLIDNVRTLLALD